MTANERWSYKIVCPKCGQTGMLHVTELDGWPYQRAIERNRPVRWQEASASFEAQSALRSGERGKVTCLVCKVEAEIV